MTQDWPTVAWVEQVWPACGADGSSVRVVKYCKHDDDCHHDDRREVGRNIQNIIERLHVVQVGGREQELKEKKRTGQGLHMSTRTATFKAVDVRRSGLMGSMSKTGGITLFRDTRRATLRIHMLLHDALGFGPSAGPLSARKLFEALASESCGRRRPMRDCNVTASICSLGQSANICGCLRRTGSSINPKIGGCTRA